MGTSLYVLAGRKKGNVSPRGNACGQVPKHGGREKRDHPSGGSWWTATHRINPVTPLPRTSSLENKVRGGARGDSTQEQPESRRKNQ